MPPVPARTSSGLFPDARARRRYAIALLTLIVLPVLYYLVEGAKERREEKRAGQAHGRRAAVDQATDAAAATP